MQQICHFKENCKSTNRHLLDVERRMHFEISRSTAAMSIAFILSITPWAFKEAVIACIGGKVKLNDIKNCNCRIKPCIKTGYNCPKYHK